MKLYDIVVVGATGLVGRTILSVLEQRGFPADRIVAVASRKSVGMEILYKDQVLHVQETSEEAFRNAQIAFFAAGGMVSRHWAPIAAEHCSLVVDNSSEFRMQAEIPLVVPEVNPRAIFTSRSRIVANPNCSTIQLVVALKPLHDAWRIRRVVVATYQAVSGAGQRGVQQLVHERAGESVEHPVFPHPIHGNALPHIAQFYSDGLTREEYKMIDETRKILGDRTIRIAPTCVRVPVANCHSEAVTIEFERPFDVASARQVLEHAPGIVVLDDPGAFLYPIATNVSGRDEVFVGRIRRDESVSNGLALWIVADNLRKGAATNAVQIAEAWIKGPEAFKVEHG